ncbi:methylated-DNA--[protein]-cysteine S-methyltransferase [bacterium]|jgi:methylated-DNA-[protein]-cysteine S-methyltransferase|nr:methylated-DNA--[protein]-cysteine S-methyltransferase [bacterium]
MIEPLRILHTPIGRLRARADKSRLLELEFLTFSRSSESQKKSRAPTLSSSGSAILDDLERQLSEYFAGNRRHFTIPLRLDPNSSTSFQRAAWRALQTIPYGQTLSYRDQAAKIGHPRAIRAVGLANGANPFPILIPCHRVIRADGSPGGYAGGLPIKNALLTLERTFSEGQG